ADDLLDLRRDAEAERQPGVQARSERAGDGGAEHQLVTTRLCISGRLAERASEQGRLSHGVNSEGRIWPRGTRPAPQGRRLARDSVRGPSRTHRANTTDGAAWLLRKAEAKAEVTRLARSDGLEQLPHAGLHAIGRLDARRPAACDDDVLAAPAGRKRSQHEERRRAFALVPLLFDLRPRLREPAMEPLDAHV